MLMGERVKPFAVGNAKSKTMTKHSPAPGIADHGHHFLADLMMAYPPTSTPRLVFIVISTRFLNDLTQGPIEQDTLC